MGYNLSKMIGVETRTSVIGHLQRGGIPTAFDRVLASKMGYGAAVALARGMSNKMVCIESDKITYRPISHAWTSKKPVDSELIELVEALSI